MVKIMRYLFPFFAVLFVPLWVWAYEQGSGSGATTQVSCLITTTVIAARDQTRFGFLAENSDSSNPVWVCLTSTCTTATGHELDPGTTNGKNSLFTSVPYEYIGPLSCIATGGTVLLNFTRLIK